MPKSDPPVQDPATYGVSDAVDPLHPAASAFAPLQPAAGVVSDDADERGQNLAGGPTASEAEKQHKDQPEKLRAQFDESQRAGVTAAPTAVVDGDEAKPAPKNKK